MQTVAQSAKITEDGSHRFPAVGDYVISNGELYRVVSLSGTIHTSPFAGAGNYMYGEVEAADWSDCPEGSEHTSRVEVTP